MLLIRKLLLRGMKLNVNTQRFYSRIVANPKNKFHVTEMTRILQNITKYYDKPIM